MNTRNKRTDTVEETIGDDFADTLHELKDKGCLLLVTGDVSAGARAKQTRRLFGDPMIDRERVLVLTDTDRTQYIDNLPNGLSPDHPSVHLLNYREPLRTETDSESSVPETHTPIGSEPEVTVDGLSDLREAITDTIAAIETHSTSLTSGELRICLTDLSILLDLYGIDATESFVQAFGTVVRDSRGMGFCYLSVANDDPIVRSLLPFFDIHIELRESSDAVSHRWHLPAYDLSSEWLPA